MATITEKSRTKEIIDRLQGIIENASPVPLASGKVTIYKDEVKSLLSELESQLEIEIKTYHEVNDRKGRILNEAKKEAEKIIYQAEHTASRMRVSKRTTNVAPLNYDMLDDEDRSALGNANEIYAASLIYTDEMLTEVTELIADAYHNIRSDYEIILQVLDEKLNTISENRTELMMGLQEMETEDRGQQILEIGQLLSNELYNERMKQKMASDEYEDGSVQLTLDLQEEQEEKTRQAEEQVQRTAQALAEMTAERDALIATVEQMKQEGMRATIRNAKPSGPVSTASFLNSNHTIPQSPMDNVPQSSGTENDMETGEEEYEIVYVDEEELEDGEEYEIEYVDEEEEGYEIEYVDEEESVDGEDVETEYADEEEDSEDIETEYADEEEDGEDIETGYADEENGETEYADEEKLEGGYERKDGNEDMTDSKEVEEAIKELEDLQKDREKIPVIPRFKKSEKVTSVSSEKIAKMAEAVTTEEKYSGLISRAVANREKAEAAVTIEEPAEEQLKMTGDSMEQSEEIKGDSDIKEKEEELETNVQGKEYVQATMQFDEEFEIMEF